MQCITKTVLKRLEEAGVDLDATHACLTVGQLVSALVSAETGIDTTREFHHISVRELASSMVASRGLGINSLLQMNGKQLIRLLRASEVKVTNSLNSGLLKYILAPADISTACKPDCTLQLGNQTAA